jgi:transposase
MAPQFVKLYVKSNKNEAADAEAICEAVQRPNMRFVAIKKIRTTRYPEFTQNEKFSCRDKNRHA